MRELWGAPVEGARFLARAWGSIVVVEASLRALGYRRTLAWIEAVPARRRGEGAPGTSVALGERLVRQAYRGHVFQGGCLPRSLVQYLLHRRDGTPARFVVGVRRAAPGAEAPAGRRQRGSGGALRGARPLHGGEAPPGEEPNETRGPGIEAHAWVDRGPDAAAPGAGPSRFAPIFDSGQGTRLQSFD